MLALSGTGRAWWVFAGCGIMVLLANTDATIANLAVAAIAQDVGVGLAQIQWILTAYLLTAMIFFVVGGKLADAWGKKRVFTAGALLFGAASLLAGVATSFSLLVVARLVQGVGFALTLSLAVVMIAAAFPPQRRGYAIGLTITLTGLGQAIGPPLGGAILAGLHWHWLFLINVPLAAASVLIVARWAPDDRASAPGPLDYAGAVLLAGTLGTLLVALAALSEDRAGGARCAAWLAACAVCAVLFVARERAAARPLFDLRLLRIRDYALVVALRALFMYGYASFLLLVPLYLQTVLERSALETGLTLTMFSVVLALCSSLTGAWCDRSGYKLPVLTAALAALAGFAALALLGTAPAPALLVAGLVLFGISAGVMMPATSTATLSSLPPAGAGAGFGMFLTLAFVGASIGVTLSAAQDGFVSKAALLARLGARPAYALSAAQLAALTRAANGAQTASATRRALPPARYDDLAPLAQGSFADGFRTVMEVDCALLAVVVLIALQLRGPARTKP